MSNLIATIVEEVPGVPASEAYYISFTVDGVSMGHAHLDFASPQDARAYLARYGYEGEIRLSPYRP